MYSFLSSYPTVLSLGFFFFPPPSEGLRLQSGGEEARLDIEFVTPDDSW